MDFASIIVGVAVAGASAAQGGGVDPAITDSVTAVAQDQAPALVQYVPDPQPYLDDAVDAVQQAQEQLPAEWHAEIENAIPPEVQDAAAGAREQLPPEAHGLIPEVVLPAPSPGPGPAGGVANPAGPAAQASSSAPQQETKPLVLPPVVSGASTTAAGIPSLTGMLAPTAVSDLTFDPRFPRNLEFARAVIEAAIRAIGLPYQWGGGLLTGPSMGDGTGGATAGYDCSGLTRFAYYIGTGGTKVLPRTSQEQFRAGQQISMDQAQPGDLLFGNWQADGANHVAIYLGGEKMIEAPQTGQRIQISAVRPDMIPARFL
ncbi:C40 family peptidase [Rhodococcus sp. NPDC019627]|uniref:C40 family peptidase n=1 Tax=unclassified Rhodococcus (in: high G+C Gram-positive bacteria) TaxID=192944 RepID=UPI0033F25E0E